MIVALRSSTGFEGMPEIFPETFTGIPFSVPSVFLMVNVFPEYAKFIAGFMIF